MIDKLPTATTNTYVGRFAPSPTGSLHFGSLIAALASYLDAKAHNGKWLVRIEDIDQPRCVDGADTLILESLQAHGMQWNERVRYQSQHLDDYNDILLRLKELNAVYPCQCTRKEIKTTGGVYLGTCRHRHDVTQPNAWRLKGNGHRQTFDDLILGEVNITDPHALEDTVLQRRDGIFSYNLVVVVDDILQGVNHIVRGADLLTTTAAHLILYQQLNTRAPRYAHIPVAAIAPGRKLSKQNHARAINNNNAKQNVKKALHFLGLTAKMSPRAKSLAEMLDAATNCWHYKNIPHRQEIIVEETESTYHNAKN